ncbi:MAG: hypothetical protein Q9208_004870 [Pyrenodesmia sp. 3 TL-2023]
MSANNSPWKGVVGSKWKNVGVVEEKPDEAATRRRSSSGAQKYNGLMNQKRNSTDVAAAARKASFAEQNKAPGFFGGLWHNLDVYPAATRDIAMAAIIREHPRKLIAGGCLVAFYFSPYSPTLFRSYGVQNIEKRYTAGGGAPNHQPGQATKLGSHSEVTGNQLDHKGMGTPHHQERFGEQRPEVSYHVFVSHGGGKYESRGYA